MYCKYFSHNMVQSLLVTFSHGSTLLGVVYKPSSVVSVECVGGFVFLYHIHVCVGRVSQEEKSCFFSSFLTLPAYTVYRAPVNVCLLLYSLTLN